MRGVCHGVVATVLLATALSLGSARADELRDPARPSSIGVEANPRVANVADGCIALQHEGPVVAAHLIVRNSVRPDVGPYTVKLPGYATDPDPNMDRYAPFLIEAQPGDTLRIDLTNQLTAEDLDNIVNLHTHGLIVSPRPAKPCAPPGDYIFHSVPPGETEQYRIDIPTTVSGVHGDGPQRGLFWFHTHMHQSSRNQVNAGQAGLISIGAPTAAATSAVGNSRLRYLALRDIQLSVPHGNTPDIAAAAGQAADWQSGNTYDSQACRQDSNPPETTMLGGSHHGYCGHVGVKDNTNGNVDATHDTIWLFTVNGQYEPTITIEPNTTEIWRIANLSATATYLLSLVDGSGSPQQMQLVHLDGVELSSASQQGLTLQHVLLMPASRAEIRVANVAPRGADLSLTLRTEGFETGGSGQPATAAGNNYIGDPWPAATLAHVVMKASDPSVPAVSANPKSLAKIQPVSAPANHFRGIAPPGCITLPGSNFRWRITFYEMANNSFRIGSQVVNALGESVDGDVIAGPHTIAAVAFDENAPKHLCAPLGSVEVWELVNQTNELHNFHIHQTKFRLTQADDSGAPAGLTAAKVVQDPGHVAIDQIPEFAHPNAVRGIDVWHDTFPIPPVGIKDGSTSPGRVFVSIPFTDPVQVGTFVFHCHILEHEDQGMMAMFEVYDPENPGPATRFKRSASAAGVPFCGRSPPPGYASVVLTRSSNSIGSLGERVTRIAAIAWNWLTMPNVWYRVR